MTYLGLPTLALSAVTLRARRRAVWVTWGIVILAALYALGTHTPLYRGLVGTIPLLTWLRVPSRAWFVVALGMTCLAAYGVQSLLDEGMGRGGRLAAAGMASAGFAIASGALVLRQPSLVALGLTLLGTGAAFMLAAWQPAGTRWSIGLLSAVLFVSLAALDATLIEGRREADAFRDYGMSLSASGRVYSPSFSVLPHEAEREGMLTLQGVNPFQFTWSAAAIGAAGGVTGDGYSITAPPLPAGDDPASATALRDAKPNVALLAGLGVEKVVGSHSVEADGLIALDTATESGDALHVYEVSEARPLSYLAGPDALDELSFMEGEANIEAMTPNKVVIAVRAPDAGLLVVTQAWAPGWRARVDGRPTEVLRVSDVVQGVEVPAGAYTIVLVYRPIADFVGLAISSLTALALVAWALIRRYRQT
jgi:hypothetical protein